MKVLCIGHSYVVASNRAIERNIAQNGHEITILAPDKWPGDLRPVVIEDEPSGSRLQIRPIKSYLTKSIHLFSYESKSLNTIVREGWDGAYIWEEPYIRASCLLRKVLTSARIPYTFLTDQNISKKYPWPFSRWEREFVFHSRGWAGCGSQVLDVQIQRGYPRENVALLPHCVDTKHFRKVTIEQKAKVQAGWGLKGPVIGYVGRFVEEKGISLILEVIDKIDRNLWGGFIFLGSGPLENTIRRWIDRRGLEPKVKIQLVKHGDMPLFLPGVDVLFSASQTRPNWKEQLGRMLIEAMACGIPNIASDSGEIPNTVGTGGLIFPESSPDSARIALESLLKDIQLRNKLGENALVESRRFSAENISEKMLQFWKKAFYKSSN